MPKTWKSNTPRHDNYQEVTDRIVAALDKGVLPWRRQWELGRCDVPINGVTGHIYRGINRVVLNMLEKRFGADPRWCSYRQALARGWQVRGGERGTRIYFYRRIERTARDGDQERAGDGDSRQRFFPLLRAYTVFHASQIDGIPTYVAPHAGERAWQTPEAVQTILDASGIEIRSQGHCACYVPDKDIICLPPALAFESADKWAEVALHEFAHATGSPKRLDRKLSTVIGSAEYAFEELIVSLATSMVGPELGINVDLDNQASYLTDWLVALRKDKKVIFRAAAEAQRIADFILGLHPDYAATHAITTGDAVESAEVPADDAVGEAA